jgi:hypothetical protein
MKAALLCAKVTKSLKDRLGYWGIRMRAVTSQIAAKCHSNVSTPWVEGPGQGGNS